MKFTSTAKNITVTEIPKESFEVRTIVSDLGFVKAIHYKGIPLWSCIDNDLSEEDFYILDESKCEESGFATIMVYDRCEDIYTYGQFKNTEHAQEWLANPKRLYGLY